MDKIIGIGTAGCNIASQFKKYSQYSVYGIDCEQHDQDTIVIRKQDSPESYESEFKTLPEQLKNLSGETLLIVCGSSMISAISLRLLYLLKTDNENNKFSVLYIKPESFKDESKRLNERVVYNVMQQYSRSGLFERLYIVSNSVIESVIGDLPVIGYYEKMNEMIVSAIHHINKGNHIKPVIDNLIPIKNHHRISTIGIYNLNENKDFSLFDIDMAEERCYYFFISKKKLMSDGKLLREIREKIQAKNSETLKNGFAIYSTDYENDYCYTIVTSKKIQA